LIDFGAEEVFIEEDEVVIYANFTDFGSIQNARAANMPKENVERAIKLSPLNLIVWKKKEYYFN